MKFSALTNLLFGSGISTEGYEFQIVSALELKQMCAKIFAIYDASMSEGPSLTFVEVESEKAIWLITGEGHFAHPSMLKRNLSEHGNVRMIRVSGATAGTPELMSIWMGQFREQDAQTLRAFLVG